MQCTSSQSACTSHMSAQASMHLSSAQNHLTFVPPQQVVSRTIGVHQLILEYFYPYIQRYLAPSQRDVVAVLAALVQACHKLVLPDCLRPVLKQLVDQFVHDKARPEVRRSRNRQPCVCPSLFSLSTWSVIACVQAICTVTFPSCWHMRAY
jgi:hypothetical protein